MTALTRHPEGSIRELWSISMPLMISTLATFFMLFTDRIFLARYSLQSLNASVSAGTFAWALMFGVSMITAMSEVFVAQYNGAKRYQRLGVPVWQMIWLAVFSLGFFIPLAIWGAPLIFSHSRYADQEIVYFRYLMNFGATYALMTAFAGFFIGQGKTKMLIILAVAANILNVGLDWVLIFGIPGLIPEMGIQGAAIATCFGYFFESTILAIIFLRKENREKFGTNQWKLDKQEFKKCCRVGFPQGIFCCLEILGWAVFYWMMTSLSELHITVASICQSFTILLSFFCDGLSRGSAAVAGNFIGSGRRELVYRVLKSGLILLGVYSLFVGGIMLMNPQETVQLLFFEQFENSHPMMDVALGSALKTCMILAFFYLFFDGVRWIVSGLLAAAGDTLFLLIAGSLSVWVLLLAPVYWIVVKHQLAVEYAYIIAVIYAALFFVIYFVRFHLGAWQKINLLSHSEEDSSPEAVDRVDPQE